MICEISLQSTKNGTLIAVFLGMMPCSFTKVLFRAQHISLLALLLALSTSAHAQHQFRASDGATNDRFGGDSAQINHLIGISGTNALVGAQFDDHAAPLPAGADRGTVYLFRNINTPSGNVTEDARLVASDAGNGHRFGASAIIEGNTGLVGSLFAVGGASNTVAGAGAAYLFRNLHLASGTVTQNVKLVASDGKNDDRFGRSVDLNTYNGNQMALVGANGATTVATIPTTTTLPQTGAAYLYRNLQSVPDGSVITETVKLMGRDNNSTVPHIGTAFGASVALRNNRALVGAFFANWAGSPFEWGKVYLYNNLDTLPSGVAYEDAKLVFPHLDGYGGQHRFGTGVALNETAQLAAVGAYGYDLQAGDSGAVFVYNDLNNIDNVSPDGQNEIFPSAVLGGSDAINITRWGHQVELSGNTLLVGSQQMNGNRGAAYLFTDVDQLNSNITTMNLSLGAQGATPFFEQVKLWNTNGAANFQFGTGIDLDGTQFMVSEPLGTGNVAQSGAAYSGDTRTFLGLDDSISLSTNGLSFWSRQNWVIGTNNDNNTITITAGDSANIGKQGGIADPVDTPAIHNSQTIIGQNAGSDNNTLIVNGTLTAGTTVVGKSGSDNSLIIGSTGTVTVTHPSLGRDFIVGENVGSDNNFVLVQSGGTLNASASGNTLSVGNNGQGNVMVVDGTVNSRTTYVGRNTGSSNNLLTITTSGVWNNAGATFVGNGSNTGNELNVNGTFNSAGSLTVAANSILSGEGTVNAVTNISGIHDPGNLGAGVQTIGGNLTHNSGSFLNWQLFSNTQALAQRGTSYDGIDLTGASNVVINPGSTITLEFNAGGSTVNWANTFWDNDYIGTNGWLLYDLATGNFTGMANFGLNVGLDSASQSLAALRPGASFGLFQSGNDVYLEYFSAPLIPEPTTLSVLALALAVLLALRLRVRKGANLQVTAAAM